MSTTQEKLAADRVNLWTPELDKLLRKWKGQISIRKQGHMKLALQHTRKHYWIGVPTTMLGTLMTAGILTTFRNCNDCELNQPSQRCATDEVIRLVIGGLGVISTALATAQTFMNYQVRGEQHKGAADSYESLYRVIDTLLLVPIAVRGDPIGTLQTIRSQYDDIGKSNPPLPEEYNIDLSYTVVDEKRGFAYRTGNSSGAGTVPKPPKPEDVITPSTSVNTLQMILNDKEDEQICIPYDIEAGVEANMMANAPAAVAANLAAKEAIAKSLQHSLAFEMRRLEAATN